MKRINSMRVAIVLLALTLITSCFVGGTFAKYTTGGTGTDSARVAKFGVTITANGSTFDRVYETDDKTAGISADSVISAGISNENVVAPGTKGDMVSVTLTGTPEVAVEVRYAATLELSENWVDINGNFYCPIEIKVGNTTFKGTNYTSAADFEAVVQSAINAFTENYDAGTDLAFIHRVVTPSVSWAWAFEGNSDINDTYLGDQAAAGNAATISLSVVTTVTQID